MIAAAHQLVSPAAPAALTPIRVVAAIALLGVIGAFVYVVRHLKKIEGEIIADDLVPTNRGPRNNMIFIVSMVTFVVVCLLLFLIVKA
jgi:hypothetical protein